MNITPVYDEERAAARKAAPIKYGAVSWWLTAACIVLAALVVIAAGGLVLMRRADAYAALGSAKTVRFALDSLSQEARAAGRPFADPARPGGVAEGLYAQVILLSGAPGDFRLLQTGPDGYGAARFTYTEDGLTVAYAADPAAWTVTAAVPILQARVREG